MKETLDHRVDKLHIAGESCEAGGAAGRRGGIAAFCGKQVPPNQTFVRQTIFGLDFDSNARKLLYKGSRERGMENKKGASAEDI